MRKESNLLRESKGIQRYRLLAIVIPVVIIGIVVISFIQAAGALTSFEAENATLAGTAKVANDPNASGGKYLVFGPASSTPTPTPIVTPTPPPSGNRTPSQILNLSNWYLTLPIGSGAATQIMQPSLNSYTSQYFLSNSTHDGVIFHAPVSGTTTSGSTHTRSELRETSSNGTLPWGWTAGSGTHIMAATEAITHLPGGNGTLGFAQIHGQGSTWYLIIEAIGTGSGTAKLVVKDDTGKATGAVIDSNYKIGTKFNLQVSAINGTIGIDYNGSRKVTTSSSMAGSYFKIGAYNQSSGDYGETVVYSLAVTHK